MRSSLRVGIIGAGRMGKIRVRNIVQSVPEATVPAIVSGRQQETEEWAKEYGITTVLPKPLDLFERSEVDAVVICSPTDTHAELITEAARAGKHIFCEKPISHNITQTIAALNACDNSGVILQLGFNRRFDPNFKKLKELCTPSVLGDIHVIKITSRDPAPPPAEFIRSSGGIFLDMTTHDFDMACHLIESEIVDVYSTGEVLIDPEIGAAGDYDTAISIVRFANGATCIIDNSRKAVYGYDQQVEVFGSKGSATAGNKKPTDVVVRTASGTCQDNPLYWFLERYQESFALEMREFVRAVREKSQPAVGGLDGLNALLAAIAATRSVKENRPISINEVRG